MSNVKVEGDIRETADTRDESRDSGQEAFAKQRSERSLAVPRGWKCSVCQCWWPGVLTDDARCNCPLEEELWEQCKRPLVYQQGTKLYYENDVLLGEVFALDDGMAHFWPGEPDGNGGVRPLDYSQGAWSSHCLRAISDHLELINAPLLREWDVYFAEREAAEQAMHQRMIDLGVAHRLGRSQYVDDGA